MKRRFQPREALLLYAAAFGCALAFFLLGVYAGRSFFPAPAPAAAASIDDPAGEPAKPDLDFYEDLVGSGKDKASESDVSERAGGKTPARPEGQGRGDERAGEPPTQGRLRAPAASQPRRFVTVQVGALNSIDEARQVMIRLAAKGYEGRLVEPTEPGDFFRVWVGEFDGEAEARGLERRLKDDEFHTYVKTVEEPARSN